MNLLQEKQSDQALKELSPVKFGSGKGRWSSWMTILRCAAHGRVVDELQPNSRANPHLGRGSGRLLQGRTLS